MSHKDFRLTCDVLLHYIVKVKNPKILLNIQFNVRSYVTSHKNIALMILLKYLYNIRNTAWKERRRCKDNHGEKNRHDASTFN